jgi:hypothetical protein
LDLEFFLKERTKFARYFYENAANSFKTTIKLIEDGEEPFVPPYSEDGEPAFLSEWLDARDALDSVGLATVSMLSSSLHLFLSSWTDRIDHKKTELKRTSTKGWLDAYIKIITDVGIELTNCPANLALIEQAVLVRNRTQHPDQLTSISISHSKNDMEKYRSPHFISENDRRRLEQLEQDEQGIWWMMPRIHVDQPKIEELALAIEDLCSWLENEYIQARHAQQLRAAERSSATLPAPLQNGN